MPTDVLLLGSSDDFLRCQINTANLDGETNLKVQNQKIVSITMRERFYELAILSFSLGIVLPVCHITKSQRISIIFML